MIMDDTWSDNNMDAGAAPPSSSIGTAQRERKKKLSIILVSSTALLAIVLGLAIGASVKKNRTIQASSSANNSGIGGTLDVEDCSGYDNNDSEDASVSEGPTVITRRRRRRRHRHHRSLRQVLVIETRASPGPSSVSSLLTTIQPATAMTASPTDLTYVPTSFVSSREQVVAGATPSSSPVTASFSPLSSFTTVRPGASPTDSASTDAPPNVASQQQASSTSPAKPPLSSSPSAATASSPTNPVTPTDLTYAPTYFVKEPFPTSSPMKKSSLSSRPSATSPTASTPSTPTKSASEAATSSFTPMTFSSAPSFADLTYSPTYISSKEAVSSSSSDSPSPSPSASSKADPASSISTSPPTSSFTEVTYTQAGSPSPSAADSAAPSARAGTDAAAGKSGGDVGFGGSIHHQHVSKCSKKSASKGSKSSSSSKSSKSSSSKSSKSSSSKSLKLEGPLLEWGGSMSMGLGSFTAAPTTSPSLGPDGNMSVGVGFNTATPTTDTERSGMPTTTSPTSAVPTLYPTQLLINEASLTYSPTIEPTSGSTPTVSKEVTGPPTKNDREG